MKHYLYLLLFPLNGFAQTMQDDSLRSIELAPIQIRSVVQKNLYFNAPDSGYLQRSNQGNDLPVLLQSLSSVVSTSDAGTGTGYTGIRVRGSDITRINVTLNGVPVNDPESQAVFFVNTPDLASSAQLIQLEKGVGQTKVGAGSFGASLSINTLDIYQTAPGITFHSDAGSFQTFKNTLKVYTGPLPNGLSSTLRMSKLSSNGYIDRSASDLRSLQWTTSWKINTKHRLTFNYLGGREKTGQAWNGVPEDSLKTNPTWNELGQREDGSFYPNQTDNYQQDYYQLFYDFNINSFWSAGAIAFITRGKGYYEEYKNGERFADYGRPELINGQDTLDETDLIRQLWLDNTYAGLKTYINYTRSRWQGGLYVNHNIYQGRHFGRVIWAEGGFPDNWKWYDLDATKSETNSYAMLEYKLNQRWRLYADLQYRYVQYQLNGFRKNPGISHDLRFDFLNPKFRLSYSRPKCSWQLTLGLAQKEPNRDDIETGLTQLPKPEKLYNAELVNTLVLPQGLIVRNNLFLMYYRDQLVLTGKINDVGAYTRSNIARSYRLGLETEIHWKFHKMLDLQLNSSISRNRILNFTEYIDDYDQGIQIKKSYPSTTISFSPSWIAGGRISIFPFAAIPDVPVWSREFSLDIAPKYVSRQFLDNTANPDRSIPSYSFVDVNLTFPWSLNSFKGQFRLGIQNITNASYVNNGYTFSYIYNQELITGNYFYPQAPRRYMVGFSILR